MAECFDVSMPLHHRSSLIPGLIGGDLSLPVNFVRDNIPDVQILYVEGYTCLASIASLLQVYANFTGLPRLFKELTIVTIDNELCHRVMQPGESKPKHAVEEVFMDREKKGRRIVWKHWFQTRYLYGYEPTKS